MCFRVHTHVATPCTELPAARVPLHHSVFLVGMAFGFFGSEGSLISWRMKLDWNLSKGNYGSCFFPLTFTLFFSTFTISFFPRGPPPHLLFLPRQRARVVVDALSLGPPPRPSLDFQAIILPYTWFPRASPPPTPSTPNP